jgi:hypothetical protein
MSLSRTNWSIDSVSRPTAASSAPSSSVTICGVPSRRGESASAFWTMPRMRPAKDSPTRSPATAASAPAIPAPVKRRAVACAPCVPSAAMNGRAR